jgi:hypothetical protein
MKTNPKRQRRYGGGKPFALIAANRDLVHVKAAPTQAATITRIIIKTGEAQQITENDAYCDNFDSWRSLPGISMTEALREILASGATLANPLALYRLNA